MRPYCPPHVLTGYGARYRHGALLEATTSLEMLPECTRVPDAASDTCHVVADSYHMPYRYQEALEGHPLSVITSLWYESGFHVWSVQRDQRLLRQLLQVGSMYSPSCVS